MTKRTLKPQQVECDSWTLFNEWSLQRMLARLKTQTRRLPTKSGRLYDVGDILWVREAHWRDNRVHDGNSGEVIIYSATPEFYMYRNEGEVKRSDNRHICSAPDPTREECDRNLKTHKFWRRYSPLLFPRWSARLFIRIMEVRREPLWEITFKDALKEGILPNVDAGKLKAQCPAWVKSTDARDVYFALWDSMHGRTAPFIDNPEVVVYTFEMIEKVSQKLTTQQAFCGEISI